MPSPKTLIQLANHYNQKEFIKSDPVQFPHRYRTKRDIEVSAFCTSWISWGNRKQIIRTAENLDTNIFRGKPFDYVQSQEWRTHKSNPRCFYRTVRYADFHNLMERLWQTYQDYNDLEACIVHHMGRGLDPAQALSHQFEGIGGIADAQKSSPCKRLWFFLRWMVRNDHIVDLGTWTHISPAQLLIPLDTHVHHVAQHLGITMRRQADRRTAQEITDYFRQIVPSDPALGDFALFGYGIEHKI